MGPGLLLLLAGGALAGPAREVAAPDPPYRRVHRAWTRELRLYGELETRMLLRATWVGPTVREAGQRQLAWAAASTPAELEAALARAEQADQGSHPVVFASMRVDPALADFGAGPDSPWRLRLQVEGRDCALIDVAPLDPDQDAALRVLYPQANAWSDLWRARFDAACGQAGTATLTVSGAMGAGTLTWTLSAP
ncbi:hypothetical protein L6R53_29445 [Myxococcota bacterium]|nr:hypothetical protein [Myxococcota bacterium]